MFNGLFILIKGQFIISCPITSLSVFTLSALLRLPSTFLLLLFPPAPSTFFLPFFSHLPSLFPGSLTPQIKTFLEWVIQLSVLAALPNVISTVQAAPPALQRDHPIKTRACHSCTTLLFVQNKGL